MAKRMVDVTHPAAEGNGSLALKAVTMLLLTRAMRRGRAPVLDLVAKTRTQTRLVSSLQESNVVRYMNSVRFFVLLGLWAKTQWTYFLSTSIKPPF